MAKLHGFYTTVSFMLCKTKAPRHKKGMEAGINAITAWWLVDGKNKTFIKKAKFNYNINFKIVTLNKKEKENTNLLAADIPCQMVFYSSRSGYEILVDPPCSSSMQVSVDNK